MLKKFLATAILVVSLHAEVEKFQVIANNANTKNNIVIAEGDVVVFSPTYFITAQKVIYDKEKGTFELFDDVVIVKDNNIQTKSEYAFLNVNTDDLYQNPNMFYEEESSIWISSKESDKKNNTVNLEESILSSCDCIDPDWSIRSSTVDYDTEDKWLNTYNTTLYIKDFPILYTPYLGFSTDKSRRTGLLPPVIGYSQSEGVFYSQPIYFAPAPNYDFELIPQVRTDRGYGTYLYYRYADSPNSTLKLSSGFFKEKNGYYEEYDLRSKRHYGASLDYERVNLFSNSKDSKDGIFASLRYLNDVEYRSLEDDRFEESTERQIESKINYIYDTPSYFLGSYMRYYIDTQKESNGDTLQELPKLQAHSYNRPIFLDKLLYSADLKYTNHYRRKELNANQYELNIPISYSFSLFDDYAKLVLKHEISANKFQYSNDNTSRDFEDGTYIESNSTIALHSDLVKPYEDFIHTVNLSVDYNHSESLEKDGDLYSLTNDNIVLSPFPIEKSSDSINLGINQSFYDKEDLTQIVNHKLKQSILYDDFDNPKLQNMENQIIYNYFLGTISNKLVYNHQDDKLIESSSNFSLTYENFDLKLGHYMSKETENSEKENLESYNIYAKYKFSDDYSIGYSTNYNLEDKIRSKQALIFNINDKCWSLDIKYEKEITPASTVDLEPIKQDIVYLQLFLKPIGMFRQKYEIQRKDSRNDS